MLSEADSVMDGRSHMHGSTARVWNSLPLFSDVPIRLGVLSPRDYHSVMGSFDLVALEIVVGGQYEVFDLGLHAVNKVLSRTGFVKPSYPLR